MEKTAEIYDPITGTWSLVNNMSTGRYGQTAILLADGRVLVAGGAGPRGDGVYTVQAEVYDSSSNVWRNAAPMSTPRGFYTAGLPQKGNVLVAGGLTLPANESNRTASAELFQPPTGRWALAQSMNVERSAGTYGGTLLPDGRFLIAGGRTRSAEVYEPSANKWSLIGSMATSRSFHTVTLLSNGTVLVSGGENADGFISAAEVLVP